MVIDFLKIVQEYVMLDLFTSQEELVSLVNYMHQKFIAEIQFEAHLVAKSQKENGSLDQVDSSSDEAYESNIYEKKLNILAVAHLILQKG